MNNLSDKEFLLKLRDFLIRDGANPNFEFIKRLKEIANKQEEN